MSNIDRAYLEIDGDQIYMDNIDIKMSDGTKMVTAMTPDNEPIGVVSGNREYAVSGDCTMQAEDAVDFHQLWVDKDEVPLEVQFEGGVTWAWDKAVMAAPGVKASHGDKVTWTIEMLCRGLQIS
jgi:hypothetical protein